MKSSRWIYLLMLVVWMALTLSLAGCGDDDDDDDDDDATDDDDDDSADDDDDDSGDDDDDDDTGPTWDGDERVYVRTPDSLIEVLLDGLPSFMWTDPDDGLSKQAMYVSTVVDDALAAKDGEVDPTNYKYNFVAVDEYDILAAKLDGDWRTLPAYADLDKGWLIQYEEEIAKYVDLRVIWDSSLGYEDFMSARMMDGGTVEMVENVLFDQDITVTVTYPLKGLYVDVNLNGLPAFNDGGTLAVYLHHIVWEAALDNFDPKTYDYIFDFITNATGGNWSLLVDGLGHDTNGLPVWKDSENDKDIHHGWIKDNGTSYELFWDVATGFDATYSIENMEDGKIVVWTAP